MESDLVFRWRTSSFSGQTGQCVELGLAPGTANDEGAVRDSKNPTGPTLRTALAPLITFAKSGHPAR
ncbi:DUF397 domain-containing protein [Actinophytocola glycyrrhizae]|uniref:DUF397 domain-containing protein n=1 Tax=Actinophytocola glycyrrhizae TaxID=2044873 RepID=A0ABV9SA23_9PSEU